MRYKLVSIKSLSCDTPRESLDSDAIDAVASTLLELGELMQPILVRLVSMEGFGGYRVVAGGLAYWAATKAKEMQPRFEHVGAFVVADEDVSLAREQLTALGQLGPFTG